MELWWAVICVIEIIYVGIISSPLDREQQSCIWSAPAAQRVVLMLIYDGTFMEEYLFPTASGA